MNEAKRPGPALCEAVSIKPGEIRSSPHAAKWSRHRAKVQRSHALSLAADKPNSHADSMSIERMVSSHYFSEILRQYEICCSNQGSIGRKVIKCQVSARLYQDVFVLSRPRNDNLAKAGFTPLYEEEERFVSPYPEGPCGV